MKWFFLAAFLLTPYSVAIDLKEHLGRLEIAGDALLGISFGILFLGRMLR